MYDRNDSAPSLLSFLLGGIVGASLICLLAPQSGIALRRRLGAAARGGSGKWRAVTRRRAEAGSALEVPEPGLPTDMGEGGRG